MNANKDDDESGTVRKLSGFYAYRNTFDEDSVWLDIPKNGQNNCFVVLTSRANLAQ